MPEDMIDLDKDEARDSELHEIRELSRENNRMLHSIQRRARFALAWKIFYWLVLAGIAYGSFVFLKPYAEKVVNTYNSVVSTQQRIQTSMPRNFTFDSLKEYFTGTTTEK